MWGKQQREKSRRECLDAAHKARTRGKIGQAIQLYEQALSQDPEDYETHARIAPLLVKAKRPGDAWRNFARAIDGFDGAGFRTKALSVAVQSVEQLPARLECWERAAELYLEEERTAEAIDVLVRARLQFKGKKNAQAALKVLRRLEGVEPSFAVRFDLARTLAMVGQRHDAMVLLDRLAQEERTRDELRLVRGQMARIRRSPGDFGRYLRALFFGR